MSDSPLLSFAIGSLAARRSNGQVAGITASFLNRRRQPSIDVNYLVSVMQQMEAHISQQDAHIADLEQRLRSTAAERDKLREWGTWADVELRKRWNKP